MSKDYPPSTDVVYQEALAVLERLARACAPSPGHARLPFAAAHDAVGVLRDLSQHQRDEAKFRNLIEHIPAVTFIAPLDDSAPELYVSPQIEQLLGFSQQEWLHDPVLWHRQMHPEDRERWHRQFAPTCATGESFRAVFRFLSKDGRVVWIHGSANVVHDDNGRPSFLQGVAFDVTESKRTEELLHQDRAELEVRIQQCTAELATVNEALRREIEDRKRAEATALEWQSRFEATL